ncbi:Glycerol-3-phosphate transporter [Polystyrenella longa]|uniref:Glycerol-3-phosphate transporter n=1 Tax=Polystyrenella longa TaxID=2528007 RepID=A0A518CMB1_9PLAN|nr:MFS transporter [Polystyrenella longa]QDU80368.1 Glycerol-3-phosphate transporter [Polystyrenella longa]
MSILPSYFKPAPPQPQKSKEEVARLYPQLRLQILSATFIGYGTFYLVRNNLSAVAKEMQGALAYDKSMIGDILAISAISYGLGKLLMGSLSDRSDARKFMAFGLLLTACCNFLFGAVENFPMHLTLWAINGFVQGMGWAPSGRSIGHWFSIRERGSIFAIWNISHNIGGGVAGIIAAQSALHWGWSSAFYVPGAIALVGSLFLFLTLKDTPQSVGLPPIEEYNDDYINPAIRENLHETELTTRELFINNVLNNPKLWLFAFANFFVYIVRYSMLDWGPTYLREVKGASLEDGGIAILVLEFGGIPSTLLIGWFSDRVGGRRGMVSLLCMIPILLAFLGILYNPAGKLSIDMFCLAVIGFFVYPPVMLLGVAALDMTSKKAVGVAAGFVGLFGYIGRTVQAKGFGAISHYYTELGAVEQGWEVILYSIVGCTLLSIFLLAFTWNIRPRA